MTERAELIKEIDRLPARYVAQVLGFAECLRQKAQEERGDDHAGYKAMAEDAEREREAREWCGACFRPASGR